MNIFSLLFSLSFIYLIVLSHNFVTLYGIYHYNSKVVRL